MKKSLLILFLFLMTVLFSSGCARKIYEIAYPTLNDGKYDSEFPYKSASKELEQISETVKKLTSIAYYKSYVFSRESRVVMNDIVNDIYTRKVSEEIFYNSSVIGTATVLSYTNKRVILLTCAHVVDFPDTVITYYDIPGEPKHRFIQSVSFKKRQSNYIAEFPEKGELEILAIDKALDIVLLGKTFYQTPTMQIPVFSYPMGKSRELDWGTFVYLVGYPKGYQMVTKGIVSQPNRDKNGSYIVDALFNRGFSGGIVLAIKDGVPNFELVGIAGSVSADFEYYITPPPDIGQMGYDPRLPYKGDVYIQFQKEINYGITFVISTEEILSFIKDNQSALMEKGYDLGSLLAKFK